MVNIILKTQTYVNLEGEVFKGKELIDPTIDVYIGCGKVSCLVGKIESVDQLIDLVGPSNLVSTIKDSCNEYEYDCIWSDLKRNDYKYLFINRLEKAIN
jgi:hypothetical protein